MKLFLPIMSHDAWVLDRMCDCYVSVHADGHQVEDGGGARPHVHRQPDEAQLLAEYPGI